MSALASAEVNMLGSIPVQNIWLLMAYATEPYFLSKKTKSAFIENSDKLPHIVATMLCKTVEVRLHQGLTSGYVSRASDLTRVRGRIDLLKTESGLLLSKGKVSCRYEELSNDTPRNQYVRSALESLGSRIKDKDLARNLRSLVRTFDQLGVSAKLPTLADLSKDRLGRHDYYDREMIDLAKMALELSMPSENSGGIAHYQPDKNEHKVRRLFEKAIAGFYRYTLDEKSIKVKTGTTLNWPFSSATDGLLPVLPNMKLDIKIDDRANSKRLIIDTKFNKVVVPGWMREETLRSGYLYQIYAYLRTQEESGDPLDQSASGLLLHPSVGDDFFESFDLQGHKISFATVDLTKKSEDIKTQLSDIYKMAS
jgi:5-methylcytosine-specific restriction enzyme subunit McrC